MPIDPEQVKPLDKGRYSPLYLAYFLQHIADEEVGKETGVEDPTKKPLVWVHISREMLTAPQFTGEEGFQGAGDEVRMYLKLLIPTIEHFLKAPHIVDKFYPHDPVRREWGRKNITDNEKIKDKKN